MSVVICPLVVGIPGRLSVVISLFVDKKTFIFVVMDPLVIKAIVVPGVMDPLVVK